jgi:hypothetical protein
MKRVLPVPIALSPVATSDQLGIVLQAAAADGSTNAVTVSGRCAAIITFCVSTGTSLAKMSLKASASMYVSTSVAPNGGNGRAVRFAPGLPGGTLWLAPVSLGRVRPTNCRVLSPTSGMN